MKKNPVLFLLIIMFIQIPLAYSQDKIKGGYKGSDVYYYEYKNGVPDESSKKRSAKELYDDKGNITEVSYYNGDEVILNTYKYDDKGSIIDFSSEYGVYYESQTDNLKYSYKYNEKGKPDEKSDLDDKGELILKTIFTYNAAGEKITEIKNNPDGSLYSKTLYKYDGNGQMIESDLYYSENTISSTRFYKYDSKGNQIEEVSKNNDGSFAGKSTSKYDVSGNLTEIIYYTEQDVPKNKSVYVYFK